MPWELIGKKIGWTAQAASDWYEMELDAERDAALARAEAAEARVAEAESIIRELADLMQGVIDHDYRPDSFTLQPARAFLSPLADAPESEAP